ncbi:hypothetical protein HYS54_02880 [Candidatus Micrarchaeota archaeon]|nr:hypothetical protein [Candidatus Micrarchaeota archaeon]
MGDDEAKRRVAAKLRNQAMDWFSRHSAEASVRKISLPTRPLPIAVEQEEVTILNMPAPAAKRNVPEPAEQQPAEEVAETLPEDQEQADLQIPAIEPAEETEEEEPAEQEAPPLVETVDASEENSPSQEVKIVQDLKSAVSASVLNEDRKRAFTEILSNMERNLSRRQPVLSLPSFVRNLHSKPELTDAVEHVLKKYSINSQSYQYLWGIE